jgi:RNA polymerase sigma factor (sigma-70 family)
MTAVEDGKPLEELAERLASLDASAYCSFADIFGPRIRLLFLRNGLTSVEAEDLAETCVTDIAMAIEKYRPIEGAGFSAWVFKIARTRLADWWRRRHPTVPIPYDLPSNTHSGEIGCDPEVAEAVYEGLSCFTERDQIIISMRHLGGEHSFVEIGDHLGIRQGTARVRHKRAMTKLQILLQSDQRIRKFLDRRGCLERSPLVEIESEIDTVSRKAPASARARPATEESVSVTEDRKISG